MSRITTAYTLFERAVAGVLLAGIVAVVILASWSFLRSTFGVASDPASPLDYTTFQTLFDRVLAALIALELAHSVHQMVIGKHGFTQVKTIVVIGVLAVVRKLILLEIEETTGLFLLGIGAAILSLGIVFALIHWVEEREDESALPSPGASETDRE